MAIVMGGAVILSIFAYVLFFTKKAPDAYGATILNDHVIGAQDQISTPDSGLPVRLIIPKLNVDAKILYMGLTADGDMDVADNNFKDVGWYQYGARPGNEGTAVIAGHVNGVRERGVFIELHKLELGDTVKILDDKDQTSSFTVRNIRMYDQNDRPEAVFTSDKGVHLNLITCAGSWDSTTQRFPDRLVVFTDRVEE